MLLTLSFLQVLGSVRRIVDDTVFFIEKLSRRSLLWKYNPVRTTRELFMNGTLPIRVRARTEKIVISKIEYLCNRGVCNRLNAVGLLSPVAQHRLVVTRIVWLGDFHKTPSHLFEGGQNERPRRRNDNPTQNRSFSTIVKYKNSRNPLSGLQPDSGSESSGTCKGIYRRHALQRYLTNFNLSPLGVF